MQICLVRAGLLAATLACWITAAAAEDSPTHSTIAPSPLTAVDARLDTARPSLARYTVARRQGDIDEQAAALEELIEAIGDTSAGTPDRIAWLLRDLAEVRLEQEQLTAATAAAEESQRLIIATHPVTDWKVEDAARFVEYIERLQTLPRSRRQEFLQASREYEAAALDGGWTSALVATQLRAETLVELLGDRNLQTIAELLKVQDALLALNRPAAVEEQLQRLDRLVPQVSRTPNPVQASLLVYGAILAEGQGNRDLSARRYRQALELFAASDLPFWPDYAVTQNNYAVLLESMDELPAALEHYQQASARWEAYHDTEDATYRQLQLNLLSLLQYFVDLHISEHDWDAAQERLDEAIEVAHATWGPNSPQAREAQHLVTDLATVRALPAAELATFDRLCDLTEQYDIAVNELDFDKALELARQRIPLTQIIYGVESLAALRAEYVVEQLLPGDENTSTQYADLAARFARLLGTEHAEYGDALLVQASWQTPLDATAAELARKAVEISLSQRGRWSHDVARAYASLGRVELLIGDPAAEQTLLTALEIWHGLHGEPSSEQFDVLSDLATIYVERDYLKTALDYSQQATQMAEQLPSVKPGRLAQELIQQGDILAALSQHTAAINLYRKASQLTASLTEEAELYHIALNRAGKLYYDLENYEAAIPLLTMVIEDFGETLDTTDTHCVLAVDYLAATLCALDRYDEALRLTNRLKPPAGEERDEAVPSHATVLHEIHRLAIAYACEQFDDARGRLVALYDRLKEIENPADSVSDDVWFNWITSIQDWADIFAISEISVWAREAVIARAERNWPNEPWNVAEVRRLLEDYRVEAALDEAAREQLQEALATWNAALIDPVDIAAMESVCELRQRLLGPAHALVLGSLSELSDQYWMLGQFSAAHKLRMQIVAQHIATLGQEHPETAHAQINAGVSARHSNRAEESESLLLAALQTQRERYGANSPLLASGYHSLALIYTDQGRYTSALPAAREATRRFREGSGEVSYDHANSLVTLHAVYSAMGMPVEAVDALNYSHSIIKQIYSPTDVRYLDSVLTGAHALSQFGDDSGLADELFRTAIEGYEAIHPQGMDNFANALNGYGNRRLGRGELAEAMELYQKCLAVRQQYFEQANHPRIAQAHSQIGTTALLLGDLTLAVEHLETSLKMRREVLGDQSRELLYALYNLARVRTLQGDDAAAYAMLGECLAIEQATLTQNFLLSSDQAIANVMDDQGDVYAWLLNMHLAGRAPESKLENSLAWALNRKGFALDAACRIQVLERLTLHDPEIMRMRSELGLLRHTLAEEVVSNQNREVVGPHGSRTSTLVRIDELQERLALEMQRRAGDFLPPRVDVQRLRQRLPADAALVEFIVTPMADLSATTAKWLEPHLVAYFVPPAEQGDVQLIDLGPYADVQAEIETLREQIRRLPQMLRLSSEKDLEDQFADSSGRLFNTLFGPFASELSSVKRLIVAPDGDLHGLPFAALSVEPGTYAVERFRVAYVSSGRDLLREHAPLGKGSLVLADPDFDADPRDEGSLPGEFGSHLELDGVLALRGADDAEELPLELRALLWRPLPGARQEAEELARALAGSGYEPVRTYIGADAAEEVITGVVSPRLIHLATHGFFVEEASGDDEFGSLERGTGGTPLGLLRSVRNPLLRSGIVLAGANRRIKDKQLGQSGHDGWLTAEEIASLDLRNTELVVLSACETGLGKAEQGHGVRGLQRAIMMAGAHSLMTTLFEIPDEETRQLMNAFYGYLSAGHPRDEALQRAQCDMIRQRRADHEAAHPFYWASFILQGPPTERPVSHDVPKPDAF